MDKVETWLDFLMLCRSRSDLQKLQSKSRWRRVSHTLQPHAVAHAHAVLGLSQPKLCWMELLLPGIANCFCMDLVLFDVWAFSEWQKMTDRSDRSKCQKWCVWIFFFFFFLFFLFFFNLFFRRRRSVWCLMLGRSSGLSCHVSPEKLSEAFKMSFRLCQVGMFFLDIAVVIGLRSQLSLILPISVTRCHRDYNFATAFDVWLAVHFCSCTVVGCRSFWNPSVRRELVNSLSCIWWPAPISEKNRMRKQSEKAKWNWHRVFFLSTPFAFFGFRFYHFFYCMKADFLKLNKLDKCISKVGRLCQGKPWPTHWPSRFLHVTYVFPSTDRLDLSGS